MDSEELCRCLSLFVVESRRTDIKPYPPKTLYHLLAGLLCHMCDIDLQAPKFLDQKESTFRKLHGTMDSLFRKLKLEGVRADVKHAGVLTAKKENLIL